MLWSILSPAQSILSTFNKVARIEVSFIASVYEALVSRDLPRSNLDNVAAIAALSINNDELLTVNG